MYTQELYYAEKYLNEYITYYDYKSIKNKKWHYIFLISEVVISAFIPFISIFIDIYFFTKFIIAFMGSLITIISAIKSNFGFHKNWVEYRTVAEMLKYHQHLYKSGFCPYNEDNKGELLITNVSAIVEKENKDWKSIQLCMKKIINN